MRSRILVLSGQEVAITRDSRNGLTNPPYTGLIEYMRALFLSSMAAIALVFTADHAWALGHQLGETKEELKLDYEVSAVVHVTSRVTVNLTIADQGRLKPLESVDLVIPSQEGTGYVDLSVSLAAREVDGKLHVRVHLIRELAERAEIQFRTWALDGDQKPRTWYYYSIPIAKFMRDAEQKITAPPKAAEAGGAGSTPAASVPSRNDSADQNP